MTTRQSQWAQAADSAARNGEDLAAGLFTLLALPNENEREHSCTEHALGFRREGRRGFRCGICRKVVKWVDPA